MSNLYFVLTISAMSSYYFGGKAWMLLLALLGIGAFLDFMDMMFDYVNQPIMEEE